MRKTRFIIIMLILYCAFSYTVNGQIKSTLNTPNIYLNSNGELEYENFPASSKDGSYILKIYSRYSCCMTTGASLQLSTTKSPKVIEQVLLSPSETVPQMTLKQNKESLKRAQPLLKKRTFYPMIPVLSTSYIVKENKESGENFIVLKNQQKVLTSLEFSLPSHSLHHYCCTGDFNDTVPCNYPSTIIKVWLDAKHRFLLVEHGVEHIADGCETGPFYLVAWIEPEE